ncbi:WhiB family transcriptional regulator [Streptomyces sp. NPDC059989]|uniref:WhiB family transcriptional regulator n=1 Tax=Streptomyces sp. NPDC059989 TaxID=3347026 RepID=UPI003698390D
MPNLSRLPGLAQTHWSWQAEALCREVGSEQFYGPWNEPRGVRERRDQEAKQLCATCPVLKACLRHALRTGEPYGVWGGLTARERRNFRAAMQPGRSRRDRE